MPSRPISSGQVKAIHVSLKAIGLDDETYRFMLNQKFGVTTCKDLNRKQAHELLNHLAPRRPRLTPKPKPPSKPKPPQTSKPKTPKSPDNLLHLASPAQHQLIHDLVREITWHTADGYKAWLKKNMRLERVVSQANAQKVITGLKGLKRHARPKEGNHA